MALPDLRQFRREPVGREALGGRNPNPAVEPLVLAGDPPLDSQRPLLDDLGKFDDAFAGRGQRIAVAGPVEQPRAHDVFQRLDLPADRRLADAEAPGCRRQAATIRNRQKIPV